MTYSKAAPIYIRRGLFFLFFVFGFMIPLSEHAQNANPTLLQTPSSLLASGTIPAPPTHFKIESGDGAAHLSWDAMPNAHAYWIYISTDGKNFTQRFKKPWVRSEISIGGLENGNTYYYGISSVGFDGQKSEMVVQSVEPHKTSLRPKWALQMTPPPDELREGPPFADKSEYAEWVSKQHFPDNGTSRASFTPLPMPGAPENFKIEPGDGRAYLTWDVSPRAIGYLLFVSEDGKNFKRRFKKPFHNHEVVISVLENGKTYYYGVEGVGPYGYPTKMTVQSVVPRKGAVISKKALETPFR